MASQGELKSLLQAINDNTSVPADIKKRAEETLGSGGPIYQSDLWIYRAVVIVLGLTALATMLGGLGLAFLGDPKNYTMPAELVALGSAAIGALAGMLAPSPREVKA